MGKKLGVLFFSRSPEKVAKDLLGKVLFIKEGKTFLKSKIVEVEAYFGERDPASWARFGKRKDNSMMWEKPGTVLIKNVHKHLMLNFVTGKKGEASAVLVRAVEPIKFSERTNGPGLLTKALKISKDLNGENAFGDKIFIEREMSFEKFEIVKTKRVGVKKDLKQLLRFYIKGNKFVSKK